MVISHFKDRYTFVSIIKHWKKTEEQQYSDWKTYNKKENYLSLEANESPWILKIESLLGLENA